MEKLLSIALEKNNIAVCVKNIQNKVLEQNEHCETFCGIKLGKTCRKGCLESYHEDNSQQWGNWGSITYKNRYLHETYFDITIISSATFIITLLQPLKIKQEKAIEYYGSLNLSKRELQVIKLVIIGLKNIEICNKLAISKATLRTHLNNIYNKVRDKGGSTDYLPKERQHDLTQPFAQPPKCKPGRLLPDKK